MSRTILVVEDEVDLAVTCVRLLQRRGWRAEVASTRAAALSALARVPALALVDRHLPDGDGLEIARSAAAAGTPVIVISAQNWTDTRRRAHDVGAAAFLGKPFSGQALLALIDSVLAAAARTVPAAAEAPASAGSFEGVSFVSGGQPHAPRRQRAPMNVLAVNCGSSSVKFRLLAVDPDAPLDSARTLAGGGIERLGKAARLAFDGAGGPERSEEPIADHGEAVTRILGWLATGGADIEAVGHRVVQGGARFTAPTPLDDAVLEAIEGLETLAPLHNRPSLAGVRACRQALDPAPPMVAVFDTGFHALLPARAASYAIPWELARRHGIRRFGFHGLSYAWATARTAALLGRPVDSLRLVALHLGSGCSAAAIRDGASVDTSMGLTPLEGLVMSTRSGDVDPALLGYLVRVEGVNVAEVERWLNESGGLLGLAGGSGDVRDLLARERDDPRAHLALEVFCHRARKYLGAYLAVLEGADAVVFTGGVGTYQPEVRRRIAAGFEWCGLALDDDANIAALGREAMIGAADSAVRALVIPADEERVIAHETAACLARAAAPGGRP